jgi:hypothetical protein
MNITRTAMPMELPKLLDRHRREATVYETAKLTFIGVNDADVYNVCQEFDWNGRRLIAGRVETRDSEISSVRFFEKIDLYDYRLVPGEIPLFQDPCQCLVDGRMVIGGTAITPDPDGRITSWRTVFLSGDRPESLVAVARAPERMKDVRIAKTDRIHVFTRPQGGVAGAGRIGYFTAADLTAVTPANIAAAPLLASFFPEGSWGGVNQILPLKNGLLGIVGHIATMSAGNVRHYYGMTFAFDPSTRACSAPRIVCERRDFAPGAAKRSDLLDVVFLGGIVRHPDGTASLYAGLSDAEAHVARIDDPFLEFETKE